MSSSTGASAAGPGLDPACHLLGAIFATGVYSLYLLAFPVSIYYLFNMRGRQVRPNKVILGVSLLLFVGITAYWVIGVTRTYSAFITHGGTPTGPEAFFIALPTTQLARLYVYSIVIGLMDSALVYRMYIVWGRRWYLLILPIVGIIAFYVSATLILTNGILVHQDLTNLAHLAKAIKEATMLKHYVTICYCLSLAVSGYATVLITARVLRSGLVLKKAGATGRSFVSPVIHVLLESAAVYFACLLITMITFLANSPGVAFMVEVTPPIVGISYSAIIIRVGLGVAERSHNASASSGSAPRSRSRLQTLSHTAVSHEYPLKVTVTQQIDRDGGADVDGGADSRATGRTSSEDKHQQPWEIV